MSWVIINPSISPQKIAKNMVLTYLHLILKLPLNHIGSLFKWPFCGYQLGTTSSKTCCYLQNAYLFALSPTRCFRMPWHKTYQSHMLVELRPTTHECPLASNIFKTFQSNQQALLTICLADTNRTLTTWPANHAKASWQSLAKSTMVLFRSMSFLFSFP